MGLNPEKNYDRNTSSIDHGVCAQCVDWIGHDQHCDDCCGHGGRPGHVVGTGVVLITSGGMFMAGMISAFYGLYDPDPVYLFYALLFCALGIFLEGYENGSR